MQPSSIAEQLLFTTVRIETISSSGDQGVGTGFIFSLQHDNYTCPFLVTNKHVVAGASTGILSFTVKRNEQPALGERQNLQIPDFEQMWMGHPDPNVDIAITPLAPILNHLAQQNIQVFYRAVDANLIPLESAIDDLDAFEDIVFIGYPNGIWDTKNYLPIIRRGTTATPISIDFQGKPQFLVDASVFPGSSGSPVFLYNTGIYTRKDGGTVVGTGRVFFLGVIASVFFREDIGRIEMMTVPTNAVPVALFQQMINLGVVFKARTVLEVAQKFLINQKILGS